MAPLGETNGWRLRAQGDRPAAVWRRPRGGSRVSAWLRPRPAMQSAHRLRPAAGAPPPDGRLPPVSPRAPTRSLRSYGLRPPTGTPPARAAPRPCTLPTASPRWTPKSGQYDQLVILAVYRARAGQARTQRVAAGRTARRHRRDAGIPRREQDSLSSSLGTAVEEGVALFADRHRLPYRPNTATARAHEVAAPEPPNHGSDSAVAGGYGVAEQSGPAAGTGVSAAGLAAW